MPRDAGGSIEIEEGTGPIRAMITTGELLEVYKSDKTFRVTTPETIDPERTNPNAPFVVTATQDVGTSNPIVARVLLQGDQMLNFTLMSQGERDAVRKQLHQCKELLVRCEICANRLHSKVKAVEDGLKQRGIPVKGGRVLNPFPQVDDLETDCSSFLVDVNRAIRSISGLPPLFVHLEKSDNNFDHLCERLTKKIGADEILTKFVKTTAPSIRRFVDMRNYFEHPKRRKTIVKNFHLLPNGQVSPPIWHLSDEDNVVLIADDMSAAIDFLTRVSEEMLIHLVVYYGRKHSKFAVQQIPENQIDRDFPVKYKMFAILKNMKGGSLKISNDPSDNAG